MVVCVKIKKLIVYRKINGFAISSRRAYAAAAAVWLSLMVVSVAGERILVDTQIDREALILLSQPNTTNMYKLQ